MYIKSAEFMAFLRILCYSIFVTECEWRITHFIGIFLTINREFLLVYYIFSGGDKMEFQKQTVLEVCMLGGFSVTYQGKEILIGRKNTLKFIQLLQLIWLRGERRISKKELIDALYDRREVADANNSINNLLHQVKKQLLAAGLPDCNYIIRIEGDYMAGTEIPVRTDVQSFVELAEAGDRELNEEKSACYYKQALDLYKGELLPDISTEIWVIEENLQLKMIFDTCVQRLADYFKRNGKDAELEALYEKAVRLFPYENWQLDQIDALLAKGENERALEIYHQMVQLYSDEMGLDPTPEMLECYEKISQSSHALPGDMEFIKRELSEKKEERRRGAYFCDYRTFTEICHVSRRNMERLGKSIYLMLCTLSDYEGKPIQNQEKLKLRSADLEQVICGCLREGDTFTRYNQSQYLIMLVGTNKENCEIVYQRIKNRLREKIQTKASISYTVASLADLKDI